MVRRKAKAAAPAVQARELKRIYRTLGYRAAPRAGDAPPLDRQALVALEQRYRADPVGMLLRVGRMLGANRPVSASFLEEQLRLAGLAFDHPRVFASYLAARHKLLDYFDPYPDGFVPRYPDIEVDQHNYDLEPHNDALGWFFHCVPAILFPPRRATFPSHADAATEFCYPLTSRDSAASTVRLVLISDFGSGKYYSRYIGRLIEELRPRPDCLIHLGDVYYAGTSGEVEEHLAEPLASLSVDSPVYVLNANHEMMSGGGPLLEYIRKKHSLGNQPQQGTYFSLRSTHTHVIAIDTDFEQEGRFTNVSHKKWLTDRLLDAASTRSRVLLLSQHEPYELGAVGTSELFDDLRSVFLAARRVNPEVRVDAWFWGDEHYFAVFKPIEKEEFAFSGCCVGHGGHPIYRTSDVAWLPGVLERTALQRGGTYTAQLASHDSADTTRLFEGYQSDREEMGNHGFCLLELGPAGMRLEMRDWLGRTRFGPEWIG